MNIGQPNMKTINDLTWLEVKQYQLVPEQEKVRTRAHNLEKKESAQILRERVMEIGSH